MNIDYIEGAADRFNYHNHEAVGDPIDVGDVLCEIWGYSEHGHDQCSADASSDGKKSPSSPKPAPSAKRASVSGSASARSVSASSTVSPRATQAIERLLGGAASELRTIPGVGHTWEGHEVATILGMAACRELRTIPGVGHTWEGHEATLAYDSSNMIAV